ncbi:Tetratricopeptide repeat protein [Pelagimonas phthalicica]|uniref:Tetratricopeptide repeat protein n=1 Tax=Pelagimonas phthalicica TaxID=1037362 RepID=A0A238J9X1_9RHOB|nr:tetratricopeptide repeat protein [Pelagimonas phthalicica]TDS93965.1 tetratricopeptide repeat protein [Pelagimonas phthalicica]SMX27510.1 Tetratricopeptide repeat protein [Pelagimonas phthalicica]
MADLSALPSFLQAQDWEKAEQLLRRAAKAEAAPAEVFYNLAKVLEAAGKPRQRKVWLQRAIQARPGYGLAWFELGRISLEEDDLEAAWLAFSRVAALDPSDGDARRNLGRVALRLGYWDDARLAFMGATDREAKEAQYRIASEMGEDTTALRDELLQDKENRAETLRSLTRASKGSLPLRL